MAAIMASDAPASGGDYVSVVDAGKLAGLKTAGIYRAIYRGRLHPVRPLGERHNVIFRSEIVAWRGRRVWRPTSQEMGALIDAGYKAEDFIPATPGELAASASPTGGASEASGAFASMSDLRAYAETQWREGRMFAAGAAPVAGSAAEGALRGWAQISPGVSVSLDDLAGVASSAAEGAMRPILETIRATLAPINESVAQAAMPRPTPPPEDMVARQMGTLRVELAQLLTRIMDAIRPMVERLAAGSYVTSEDIAPFMGLVGELAMSLAGSPFYELAPRDAPALMPGLLAQAIADGAQATPDATPAPDAGKE